MNRKVKLGLAAGNIGLLMAGVGIVGVVLGWDWVAPPGLVGLAIFAMVWFNIIQPYKYSDNRNLEARDG